MWTKVGKQDGGILLTFLGGVILLGTLAVVGTSLVTSSLQGARRAALVSTTAGILDQAAYSIVLESPRNASDIPVAPAPLAELPAPADGGQIHAASSAPKVDAFGTPLGYCTNAATSDADPVFAIASAGPDKTFNTTCAQALTGAAIADDGVRVKTVADLRAGIGGTTYFGDPVSNYAELSALPQAVPGEMRVVLDPGALYVNATGTPGAGWTLASGSGAEPIACKSGYMAVDGYALPDGQYVPPFCVMQYEARIMNNGRVTSDVGVFGAAPPVVNVTWLQSKELCAADSAQLINENQWLSIAHQATTIASNWSGGAVGSGALSTGWSAHSTHGSDWTNTAVAPANEAPCLYNTGSDACGAAGDSRFRRTLTLPGGGLIWDLSGNAWEWVDAILPASRRYADGESEWFDYHTSGGTFAAIHSNRMPINKLPSSSWTTENGVGRYYDGSPGHPLSTYVTESEAPFVCAPGNVPPAYCDAYAVFARGGHWSAYSYSGVFSLNLNHGRSSRSSQIGFRCAYDGAPDYE